MKLLPKVKERLVAPRLALREATYLPTLESVTNPPNCFTATNLLFHLLTLSPFARAGLFWFANGTKKLTTMEGFPPLKETSLVTGAVNLICLFWLFLPRA